MPGVASRHPNCLQCHQQELKLKEKSKIIKVIWGLHPSSPHKETIRKSGTHLCRSNTVMGHGAWTVARSNRGSSKNGQICFTMGNVPPKATTQTEGKFVDNLGSFLKSTSQETQHWARGKTQYSRKVLSLSTLEKFKGRVTSYPQYLW